MAVETVDALELEIRASAESAARKIADLSASVASFAKDIGQYVNTVSNFAKSLKEMADAASRLSGVKGLKSIISVANGSARGSRGTSEAKRAAAIARQENLAWKEYDKWNRDYYKDHRLNWSRIGISQRKESRPFKDNTAKEIAEWKAAEDAKLYASQKEAAQIAREMDLAWKGEERRTRELDRAYAKENRLNWKRVDRNVDLYNKSVAVPDNTAKEIAEWKAAEDIKYERYMKQFAEGVVQSKTSGGKLDMKTIVEESTGISRAMKDAEDSARAMMDAMNRPEAFKSAKESARVFTEAFNKPSTNRAEFDRMISEISTRQQKIAEEKARNELQSALSQNTPEWIRYSRGMSEKKGQLDKWQELTGQYIPGLADRGVAAGLIDEKTAQAMKDAAAGATELKQEATQASEATNDLAKNLEEAGEAGEEAKNKISLKGIASTIGKSFEKSIFGQLARVAKMRALRAIVRGVASSLKEGIGNLYQWSKGLKGDFAASLDTAASKLMLAKNSIATAFAPAIQALIPVLNTVVSWVNAASNAIAQFIALLTGQNTWTAATESVEEWAAATKSGAGGASKAVKDLLADWDELNVIQSESGGGGGGGSSKKVADYGSMFKEMTQFDKWTEHFEQIRDIVFAIGAGIAGWFVLTGIQNFMGKLGILSDTALQTYDKIKQMFEGVVFLYVGVKLAEVAGKTIADEGFSAKAVATGVTSAIASALGGKMLFAGLGIGGKTGGVLGAIVGLAVSVGVMIKAYIDEKNQNAYDVAKDWVEKNAFEYDIEAKLNLINATITATSTARNKLSEDATELLGTIYAIKLGINDADTLDALKTQLGDKNSGIIADINSYATEQKNLLRLRYTLVPATDAEGNDVSAEEYMRKSAEWDSVGKWFEEKGRELGERLVLAEKGEIDLSTDEIAQSLIKQINDVLAAVSEATIEAKAAVGLNVALASGEDDKIPQAYEDYVKEIRESANTMYEELITGQNKLVNFYRSTKGEESEEYKKANDELLAMLDQEYHTNYIESFIGRMTKGAEDRIKDYFIKKYNIQDMIEDALEMTNREHFWSNEDEFADSLKGAFMRILMASAPDGVIDFLSETVGLDELLSGAAKSGYSDATAAEKARQEAEAKIRSELTVENAVEKVREYMDFVFSDWERNANRSGGYENMFENTSADILAAAVEGLEQDVEDVTDILSEAELNALGEAGIDPTTLRGEHKEVMDMAKQALEGSEYKDTSGDFVFELAQVNNEDAGANAKGVEWYDPNHAVTIDAARSGLVTPENIDYVANAVKAYQEGNEAVWKQFAALGSDGLRYLAVIANKDPRIVVSPTVGFGRTMSKSSDVMGAIRGYVAVQD